MPTSPDQIKQLKQALWVFIVLGTAMAAINTVFGPDLDVERGQRLAHIYNIFNTAIKTAFILYGGLLVYRLFDSRFIQRRKSLGLLLIAGIVLGCLLPIALGVYEFIYFLMPFPFSTYPLQVLYDGYFMSVNVSQRLKGMGTPVFIATYILWQILIYTLVARFGRRIYCSGLCLHAGLIAESFSEAMPLVGAYEKGRQNMSSNLKVVLLTLKIFALIIALGLWLFWLLLFAGLKWIDPYLLRVIEGVKLMAFDFILMYMLMIVSTARGYCYYCPAGTALSFFELLFKHKLNTNKGVCVSCASCNASCEMGINIMVKAKRGRPLQSGLCVGCGHCVDICPTKTLQLEAQSRLLKGKEVFDDEL